MQLNHLFLILAITASHSAAWAATEPAKKTGCSDDMHRIYQTEFQLLDRRLGELNQKLWDLGCTNPAKRPDQSCSTLIGRDYRILSATQQKAYSSYSSCRASRQ